MKKSTEELLKILKNTSDISDYLEGQQENLNAESLPDTLNSLLEKKSISKSQCIQKSGLDRTYCYQIFSGVKRPSRDKLLALCIAMQLTIEEVQGLLKQAGYAILYPKNQRDSVLLFAFHRKLSLTDTNELLFEMDLPLIQ